MAPDKTPLLYSNKLKFLTSFAWGASEIVERERERNMIYLNLEKQFSRDCHGGITHRPTDSCATFVLHLFSRERERHDESSREMCSTLFPESYPKGIRLPARGTCVARWVITRTHNQMLHRRIFFNKFCL